MTTTDLNSLEQSLLAEIANAGTLDALEQVRISALGKKGRVSELMQTLGKLPPDERKAFGQSVNAVKTRVTDALDLRKGSPTYGKWEGVVLSAENKRQFFIPRGFAHGFLVLSDTAEFCYKCDDVYHPNDEGGLMWNDPAIGIEWPALEGDTEFDPAKIILSDKDKRHPSLSGLLYQNFS